MLPTSVSKGRSSSSASRTNPMFPQYLRRIIKKMKDLFHIKVNYFPLIVWVHCSGNKWILNILSGKCFTYALPQKSCKFQPISFVFATVDVILPTHKISQTLLLSVATIAYCAAYDHSATHAIFVVISVLLFHFLITGAMLATFCW
ncbi:hypothetical protein WN944_028744 [Citrus x changshan-huyou]|uniref:Uncharacterized protein n=1 Tax=Citrus x changshan-huyou TaxID=2935761 RepID=A0AAP0LNC8_9ROSI